jgi:hypothetical protein
MADLQMAQAAIDKHAVHSDGIVKRSGILSDRIQCVGDQAWIPPAESLNFGCDRAPECTQAASFRQIPFDPGARGRIWQIADFQAIELPIVQVVGAGMGSHSENQSEVFLQDFEEMLHPVPKARKMIEQQTSISIPAGSDQLVPQI